MSEEFIWVEKYAPKTVAECILPKNLREVLDSYVDHKYFPTLLLTGSPGTGKSSVAKALCWSLDFPFLFINASKERGIDTIRTRIAQYASTTSLNGHRKVIILDEADNLTNDGQLALRGVIETFQKSVSFILTGNYKGQFDPAILSRCTQLDFSIDKKEKPGMAMKFQKRLEQILTAENIPYDKNVLTKLVITHFPDFRQTIIDLQKLALAGSITEETFNLNENVRIDELIDILKSKRYTDMRKWVNSNLDIGTGLLYKRLYSILPTVLVPDSLPTAILILAKYLYQNAFVADVEINTVAMLTEIMLESNFV